MKYSEAPGLCQEKTGKVSGACSKTQPLPEKASSADKSLR
jgi:hypothetical protein